MSEQRLVKEYQGKFFVQMPEIDTRSCKGCYAQENHVVGLCDAIRDRVGTTDYCLSTSFIYCEVKCER